MKDMAILDVAIGLVLMYLVISLICSIGKEWLSQIGSWRAKNLEAAIFQMLGEKQGDEANARKVLDHPLVKMVEPNKTGAKPSYIAAGNFALALVHALGITRDANGKISAGAVQTAIDNLGANSVLAKSLQPLLDKASGDATEFVKHVEAWFDNAMERATGWYTRTANYWLFGLGFIVAAAVNADTIDVTIRLSKDSALRNSVATYAVAMAAAADASKISTGSTKPEQKPDQKADDNPTAKWTKEIQEKVLAGKTLDAFGGLPLGWSGCWAEQKPKESPTVTPAAPAATAGSSQAGSPQLAFSFDACYRPAININCFAAFLLKVLGIAITGMMVSLGAPFWFGLLQQFGAIRATGPKPLVMKQPPT